MEVSEYESIIIYLIQNKYPKAIKSSKAKKRNFTYFHYFAQNLQILDFGIIDNIFRKFIDNHCANFYTNPYKMRIWQRVPISFDFCINIIFNGLKCLVLVRFSLGS